MSELGTQLDYWNSRAEKWGDYDAPLIPGQQDLDFMSEQLVKGGDVLVLGVTQQLCSIALESADTVTAVDYSPNLIETFRIEGVNYECLDWNEYFEQTAKQYDNIMTDGGLLCLEFPGTWKRIANNISAHLKPNGIFAARIYVTTPQPPKSDYGDPNLDRFISSLANVDENWMLRPQHPDYIPFDVRYALPPEAEVLKVFGHLVLHDKLIPNYAAGEHFPSYAWQR